MNRYIPIVIAALALAACTSSLVVEAPPVVACESGVTLKMETAELEKEGDKFEHLAGIAAVAFVQRTGGGRSPWIDKLGHLIIARDLIPGAVVVAMFDKQECKFGQVTLPVSLVDGRGA